MLIWDDGIVWWGCQGIRLQGCKIMYILHTCNKEEPRLLSASADCRRACVPEVCGLFRFTNSDQSWTRCLSETDVGTRTILSSLGILFCRWNITRTKVGIAMVCNLKKYMSLCSPRQEPEQRCTGEEAEANVFVYAVVLFGFIILCHFPGQIAINCHN